MAAGHKKPGSGKYPLLCLDSGPPPTTHHDHYVWGSCDCALCRDWKLRLDDHDWATKQAANHPRSCMCEKCRLKRSTLIQLLVVENIRDLWSEISWVAMMDQWEGDWVEWLMEELSDPARSVGWFASQLSHQSMLTWQNRYFAWRERRNLGKAA